MIIAALTFTVCVILCLLGLGSILTRTEPHIRGRAPWGEPRDIFGGEPWTLRFGKPVKFTWKSW